MITNSIAKSFMFFLIFTPVIKSIAKEPTAIEELIKNGDLKIIAVPSKYNINLTQKIHVSLYIINESQKNINFHLMGGKSKNFAVSNVIEGAYFAVEDGNLSIIGHCDEFNGGQKRNALISIDGKSAYRIPKGVDLVPFSVFSKNNIAPKNLKFAMFNVKLTINSMLVKSSDFNVYLEK